MDDPGIGAAAPVRVVIVEDHEALRRGTALIARREGLEVVGAADRAVAGEDVIDTTGRISP